MDVMAPLHLHYGHGTWAAATLPCALLLSMLVLLSVSVSASAPLLQKLPSPLSWQADSIPPNALKVHPPLSWTAPSTVPLDKALRALNKDSPTKGLLPLKTPSPCPGNPTG